MITAIRRLPGAGLALADLGVLITLRPDPAALARDVTGPHAWIAAVGPDAAATTVAGAALWCVAVWLGLGLLAAAGAALPGAVGRAARCVTRALLPAAVYRVVAGAAGLGVLLAPVAAGARGTPPTHAATTVVPRTVLPAPTWPTDPPGQTPTLPAPTLPAPTVPASTRPASTLPTSPTPGPERAPAGHRAGPATPGPGRGVVVRPGDSLWRIAAERLGRTASPARVAAAWPQWYDANRRIIGADPDLIQPGQHLQAPAPAARR